MKTTQAPVEAQAFALPVTLESGTGSFYIRSEAGFYLCKSIGDSVTEQGFMRSIVEAVNSHARLLAENAKLLEALRYIESVQGSVTVDAGIVTLPDGDRIDLGALIYGVRQ